MYKSLIAAGRANCASCSLHSLACPENRHQMLSCLSKQRKQPTVEKRDTVIDLNELK
jgi:hypothetical protein